MSNGWISQYQIYVSDDGKTWGEPAAQGSLKKDKDLKKIIFTHPEKCQYIRFVALKGIDGQKFASMAELDIIARKDSE